MMNMKIAVGRLPLWASSLFLALIPVAIGIAAVMLDFGDINLVVATLLGFVLFGLLLQPLFSLGLWQSFVPPFIVLLLVWWALFGMFLSRRKAFMGIAFLLIILHTAWAVMFLIRFE
jgi:hypothetical protein